MQLMALERPAHALFEQGDLPEAVEAYQQILKAGPGSVQLFLNAAYALMALGRLDEAVRVIQKGLNAFPDEADLLARWKINGELMLAPDLELPPARSATSTGRLLWVSPCGVDEMSGGQHPPQVARALSQLGYTVDYVQVACGSGPNDEPFGLIEDPFLLQKCPPTPFQWQRVEPMLSAFVQDSAPRKVMVLMVFSPYLLAWVDWLKARGVTVVYWCLDNWSALNWPDVPQETETHCIEKADILLATAQKLVEKLQDISRRPCHLVQNGVDLNHFHFNPFQGEQSIPQQPQPPCPSDWVRGREKTFVYWGNLANAWVDWAWLLSVADKHPEWQFNLIGNIPDGKRQQYTRPNVSFLGMKPRHLLQQYGAWADIGVIHFVEDATTEAVNPVKAYEYLACGLSIISTPMPELNAFPQTWQVRTVAEFEAAVQAIEGEAIEPRARETKEPHRETQEVAKFVQAATWQCRALALLEHLDWPVVSPDDSCQEGG